MVDCISGILSSVTDCFCPEDDFDIEEVASVKYPGLKEGPPLVLYSSNYCGFCRKVMDYMTKNGIQIPMKDASNPQIKNELFQIGGKKQIPCLIINGQAKYESDDIIKWLESNRDTKKVSV